MSDLIQFSLIGSATVLAWGATFLVSLMVAVLAHGQMDITSQQSALMAKAMLTAGIVGIILGIVIASKGGLTEGK